MLSGLSVRGDVPVNLGQWLYWSALSQPQPSYAPAQRAEQPRVLASAVAQLHIHTGDHIELIGRIWIVITCYSA